MPTAIEYANKINEINGSAFLKKTMPLDMWQHLNDALWAEIRDTGMIDSVNAVLQERLQNDMNQAAARLNAKSAAVRARLKENK